MFVQEVAKTNNVGLVSTQNRVSNSRCSEEVNCLLIAKKKPAENANSHISQFKLKYLYIRTASFSFSKSHNYKLYVI